MINRAEDGSRRRRCPFSACLWARPAPRPAPRASRAPLAAAAAGAAAGPARPPACSPRHLRAPLAPQPARPGPMPVGARVQSGPMETATRVLDKGRNR